MPVVLALLLIAASAPEVEDARARFSSGDYQKAALLLENFLARAGLANDVRRDGLLLLGAANIGLGYVDSSKRKFAEALMLDPSARGSDFAPKIVRVIDAVRSELFPLPTVSRAPIFIVDKGEQRLVVELRLMVRSIVTPARPNGAPLELCTAECRPLRVESDGRAALTLDLGDQQRAPLVWYVRTLDTREYVLGSEAAPERDMVARDIVIQPRVVAATLPSSQAVQTPLPKPGAKPAPFYTQWWFWTPIAAVVAGGVAASVILATRPQTGPTTLAWQVIEAR